MMKIKYMCSGALLLIFAQLCTAEQIDIKGKAFGNDANPIEQARVSLKKHPELVVFTSSDGTFSLQSGTPVKNRSLPNHNFSLTVENNRQTARLCLNSNNTYSSITAALHSLDGRLIVKKDMIRKSTQYYFEIPYNHPGVSVLKIKLDNTDLIFPLIISHNSISITGTSRDLYNAHTRYSTLTAATDDTLIVYKKGFRTHYLPVSYTPEEEISIELTNSKPWLPESRSSLTFAGGMVKILANGYDFEMGQPNDTIWGRIDDGPTSELEQPVHTVTFAHDFWIDTSEVCQGEFDSLMKQYPKYINGFSSAHGYGKNYPAYAVSWEDAVLFCNARSKRDGFDTIYTYSKIIGTPGSKSELVDVKADLTKNGYHLPTEAQWEYACRGGTFTDYYWGKNLEDYESDVPSNEISTFAVWYSNSFNLGLGSPSYGTHQVANKEPNAYGLYDMVGNVSEYCHDWLSAYSSNVATDPSGPESGSSGDVHVSRGGNWGNDVTFLRSSGRYFNALDYFYFFIGFRCARTIQ